MFHNHYFQNLQLSATKQSKKIDCFWYILIVLVNTCGALFSQVNTFTYTGAMQTYIVPTGITLLGIDARGAAGATGDYGPGGSGGRVTCTLNVTPGTTLNIFVGQKPTGLTGGYNGGGNGVLGVGGSAGGGATDIRIGGVSLLDRVIVAGGGGGSGYSGAGAGGGLIGGSGGATSTTLFATGGTQTSGGTGGSYYDGNCSPGAFAQNGSLGLGGNGLVGVGTCTFFGGAGGGGGYYGGGGMQINGAGGGSSYTGAGATNVTHFQGYNTGHGQLTITTLFGVTSTQTNVTCSGGSNGSASVAVTSASVTGPYSYSWMPSGGSSNVATGLSSGSYTCLVSSSSGTAETIVNITEPPTLTTSVFSQTNVTCFGGNNGASTLYVNGGVGPYTYTWSPVGGNSYFASGLTSGSYTTSIRDANNCLTQQVTNITEPSPVLVSTSASNPTICNGGSTVLSGVGASTYTWTGGVINSISFSPTITTTYSVVGTNSLGCISSNTAVTTVTVYNLPFIMVNSGAVCLGETFVLNPSGAVSYTFSSTSNSVSPTINTSYSVVGVSSFGCLSTNTAVSSVTVKPLPIISVNSGSICSGNSFTISPSGANTYTFSGGTAVVSPSANTTYSISGTSSLGCVSSSAALSNLTVVALPLITVNSGTICEGQSFTLSPSGAVTYSFSSGNNVVTPSLSTSYSVSGTGSSGCVKINGAIGNVTVHPRPLISVNSGSICSGQIFTMIPSGANSYTFSNGSNTVSALNSTNYSVTGTSSLGCASSNTAISSLTVQALPLLTVSNGTICYGDSFTINPTGASSYSFSSGSSIVSPSITSNYTVTGFIQGCSSINSPVITVQVNALPTLTLSGQNSVCQGKPITQLVNTPAVSYTWSNGSTGNITTYTPTVNTVCSVTVTSSEGCTNSASQFITVDPLPNLYITASSTILCVGNNLILSANGAASYSWTGSVVNNSSFTPSASSVYSVTGFASNGCSATSTISIIVNPLPIVSAISSESLICISETATLMASGAVSYTWSNGFNGSSLLVNPSQQTSYSVTGEDSNGCLNAATVIQDVDECTSLKEKMTDVELTLVFPNPNNGSFTLRNKLYSENSIIEIYNSQAQLVFSIRPEASTTNIELIGAAKGFYFVILKDTNKVTHQLKMIVN